MSSYVQSKAKKKKITLQDLIELAASYPNSPFYHAVQATSSISKLPNQQDLPLSILFPITLFAETDLMTRINKGQLFWKASHFGRELEVDPESHRLFIHLRAKGKNVIGKGRQKFVIKTVLYDRKKPRVMAYGFTENNIDHEIEAMSNLRGLPNVMDAEGFLSHRDPHSKKVLHGLVTKIYNAGSLQDVIYKRSYRLTLREKVQIARDLVNGLNEMHTHHYVHRDLGAKNYFINILGKKPGHRKITCCVADMGRTTHTRRLCKMAVQGNSWYMPPEGYLPWKMKGKDYYQSDLFAFGCAMWNLYYGHLPAWSYERYIKYGHGSIKNRRKNLISHIRKERAKLAHHISNMGKGKTMRKGFLRLIVKMTHPSPKKRGSTASTKQALESLLQRD